MKYAAALALALLASCEREQPVSSDQQRIAPTQAAALSDEPEPERKTIGLVLKSLSNPYFAIVERGARQAADEFEVDLTVKTGTEETSFEQQRLFIERFIEEDRVDAIVITPASSTDLIPTLKRAREAGIPVINVDERLHPEALRAVGLGDLPYVGVDNRAGAYRVAKHLAAQATGPTQAAIIEGHPDALTGQFRREGAAKAFAENPQIELVASEPANWDISHARRLTQRLLAEHPKLGLIFCANDLMALGTIQALQEVGRRDVLVAGYDNLEQARAAVRAGHLLVTGDQQADQQGYHGVRLALEAVKGGEVPPETLIEVKLITAASLESSEP